MRNGLISNILGAALLLGVGTCLSTSCTSLTSDCVLQVSCDTCIPDNNLGHSIADSCGIFVSSSRGDDNNPGTKEAPFNTLQVALAKANAKTEARRVYACAGETFTESLTIDSGLELYGALDCTNAWNYNANEKTTLKANADQIPLTLKCPNSKAGCKVFDFSIVAANASKDGGSSIAVVADQAMASMIRCDITAGDGKSSPDVIESNMKPNQGDPLLSGNMGQSGCKVPGMLATPGAPPKQNDNCPVSVGGRGGDGKDAAGGNGDPGQPVGQGGQGGLGQSDANPTWKCNPDGWGITGAAGADGTPGPGAGPMSLGMITPTGYMGVAGTNGTDAKPGQGGGGGGGYKGTKGMCGGPSGGSGGAGGCGGRGGNGGSAGGASIGVISLEAQLELNVVTIKIGAGGNGGAGGVGFYGGTGGYGGQVPIGSLACIGGGGGHGGQGGHGGGGRGGHAIGIAYTGAKPDDKSVTFSSMGTPGAGGLGTDMLTSGALGVQAPWQIFP